MTGGHFTTIQTCFGPIRVQRVRGYCRRCHKWRFAADAALGLPTQGTQSPAVQEMAALTVSKMPATEAEQVVERLAGVKILPPPWVGRRDSKVSVLSNSAKHWTRR